MDPGAEGQGRQQEARKKMGSNSMNPREGLLLAGPRASESPVLLLLPLIDWIGKRKRAQVSGNLIWGGAGRRVPEFGRARSGSV